MTTNKTILRTQCRDKRRALSHSQQEEHAILVCDFCKNLPEFNAAKHIAAYLAQDGELNPTPLIQAAWLAEKSVYLPVIDTETLRFSLYTPDTILATNTYNIPEPINTQTLAIEQLDLVFMPLVGFDESGNRLGMGAGFYDKTFADHANTCLIALAHDCQAVRSLPTETHDIIPNYIITETGPRPPKAR